MYESCLTQTSHVTHEWILHIWIGDGTHMWSMSLTYGWVMFHTNESCQIWIHHVTGVFAFETWPHMYESCLSQMSHVTHERVLHTNERVISHIFSVSLSLTQMYYMSLGHFASEQWVRSHLMSHVTYEWVVSHMNQSCHIEKSVVAYEWVLSHMNESCRHEWVQ